MQKAFQKLNIQSSIVSHFGRHLAPVMLASMNVDKSCIEMAGRWKEGSLDGSYLAKTLPLPALRVLAGFRATGGDYFLHRNSIIPPKELLDQVFPGSLKMEGQINSFCERTGNSEIAGSGFLKFINWIKIVILQDAVFLLQKVKPDKTLT